METKQNKHPWNQQRIKRAWRTTRKASTYMFVSGFIAAYTPLTEPILTHLRKPTSYCNIAVGIPQEVNEYCDPNRK